MSFSEINTEYLLFGGAAIVSVLAFTALILVPALGSYGRTWEKVTAGLLSMFILVTLILVGIGIGVLIVVNWDSIYGLFT